MIHCHGCLQGSWPCVAVPADSLPLSGKWRFAPDPDGVGEAEGWANPGFDDSAWCPQNISIIEQLEEVAATLGA